jgi:hypothetical protein
MSPAVQLLIVAIVVLAAAAYIARRVWRRVTASEASSGCSSCSQAAGVPANLVPLESLTSSIDQLPPARK